MKKDEETIRYLKAFEQAKTAAHSEPSWLRGLREEAMTSFVERGFPTLKDEAWRYTDVSAIRETPFIFDEDEAALSSDVVASWKQKFPGDILFVVNGKFSPIHSRVPEGVEVMDLEEAIAKRSELVAPYLDREALKGMDAFSALNAAFSRHGLLIHVPARRVLSQPIQVVFLTDVEREHVLFSTRTFILMGKGSKASIVEIYASHAEKAYFTNAFSEFVLEPEAILEHAKIQIEPPDAFHIASTRVTQQRGSVFSSCTVSTGSRLMRNNCSVALAGEGASCALNGLYLGDGSQLLDHHTFVDHQKPDGKSQQFFKGLFSGHSRGVFSGRVLVRQDAQRTDAQQVNKNLLLSDDAKVDTQPQLEILADDVKCSHGAAVGQLQEDAIFYLRSRGIDEKNAGRMLAEGFAREVTDRSAPEYLKLILTELVDTKLKAQFKNEKGIDHGA